MNLNKVVSTKLLVIIILTSLINIAALAQSSKKYDSINIEKLKKEVAASVDLKQKSIQEMVDMVFSIGELGFQEVETSKYLISVLEKNGFIVEKGISNIPTAWMAKWGSGSPVIALGSDLDCIPKASQKPGVA